MENYSKKLSLQEGYDKVILCPLFLFLFTANTNLYGLLNKAMRDTVMEPIKICRCAPGISHLFADYTMIFYEENASQDLAIKNVLNTYASATGNS
jgi:hypothetical protein